MKHSKIIFLLAITFIVIAGLIFFLKPDHVAASTQDDASTKIKSSVQELSVFPRENLNLSKSELETAVKETVLFHEIQDDDLKVSSALPLSKSGKGMAVRYNQNIIETKKVGDIVKFQMLEYGINRSGEIVEIEKVDDDILRWHGRFQQGSPERNFFTITQSQKDQYTIIQIYSDKGNYTAEIKNGQGVVQSMDEGVEDHELHAHDHEH
ncbi:metalloprotease secretion chaperone CpaB [Acinetobacter halotolerans]|uniref:Metalloprotease secretion chaperone CpaB n=1 Tax=Acinetobacter halotolerans TaxID=1752076 RepID=A0A4V2DAQ7_9GAMM|nr:metalloprotease secretion chaperone CpaB [Acinetobacter halotolerans]RZF50480.1 metalloprotease secretion chaperone CpaB [Acinetobacter halotolerans]